MNMEATSLAYAQPDNWLGAAGIQTFETDDDTYGLANLAELDINQLGMTADRLLEIAATQPDDVLALSAIRRVFNEVVARGDIEEAMQMSMTIGAMACMHSHMTEFSNSFDMMSSEQDYGPQNKKEDDDEDYEIGPDGRRRRKPRRQ